MRIGFDISQLAYRGGVPVYTDNLSRELSKNLDLDLIFFYSSLRKPYNGNLKNVKEFKIPPTVLEILFNRLRFVPIESFIGEIDVYHSSDWLQPKTRAKKVTTYHDVIPLKFPEWSNPKIVSVHKKRLEIVEKEIDIVIAVSESTKKDLLGISKIPEEKIVVIYEGVGKNYQPQPKDEIEAFKNKYNLPDKFVLAIGGIGERKNIRRIKEATRNFNLVILGETIKNLSDEELPLLYSSAHILLYPSFYEGFGLPILQAMACGTPVVTSYNSSLIEVSGDAAEFAEPKDVDDIRRKLEKVSSNEDYRKILIKKGLVQASKFSWEKCAEETFRVYKKLI